MGLLSDVFKKESEKKTEKHSLDNYEVAPPKPVKEVKFPEPAETDEPEEVEEPEGYGEVEEEEEDEYRSRLTVYWENAQVYGKTVYEDIPGHSFDYSFNDDEDFITVTYENEEDDELFRKEFLSIRHIHRVIEETIKLDKNKGSVETGDQK